MRMICINWSKYLEKFDKKNKLYKKYKNLAKIRTNLMLQKMFIIQDKYLCEKI